MPEWLKFLSGLSWVPILTGSVAASLLTAYINSRRSRLTILQWHAHSQPFASAVTSDLLGRIEIRFDGQRVDRLRFVTVELRNLSRAVDLKSFTVAIVLTPPSEFLGEGG